MASDEDYMAFLNKANQDPSAGQAVKSSSSAKQTFKTTDSGAQVPAVLKTAVKDAFYTSDADEPFEPVCLNWDEGGKGLPDEGTFSIASSRQSSVAPTAFGLCNMDYKSLGHANVMSAMTEEFASLISHSNPSSAQIEIQDPAEWDPQGQYSDLLDAVRQAGKGNDVRVYKIKKDGTRVEYWVVTTEGKGKDAKLVGVKALAIES